MSSMELSRPARLWKGLSEERRLAAASAFWSDEQGVAEQAEMIGVIARQINFRPKSVLSLPLERKAKLLARSAQVSDLVAARALVSYHLAHQRPMMKAFLDALELPHEDGLLNDDIQPPDAAKLQQAGRRAVRDVSSRRRAALLHDAAAAGSRDLERTGAGARERASAVSLKTDH